MSINPACPSINISQRTVPKQQLDVGYLPQAPSNAALELTRTRLPRFKNLVVNTLRWTEDYGSLSSLLSRCCSIAVNLSVVRFFMWCNSQSFRNSSIVLPLCPSIGFSTFGGITNGNFALLLMQSDVLWKSLSLSDVTA